MAGRIISGQHLAEEACIGTHYNDGACAAYYQSQLIFSWLYELLFSEALRLRPHLLEQLL